jgi:hypothetical protein
VPCYRLSGIFGRIGLEMTMRGRRYWVHNGDIEPTPAISDSKFENEDQALHTGSVRLTTGDLGTEIKWVVNSPCFTSLFKTMSWLTLVKPPYILRFFAIGWFEEVWQTSEAAIKRIEQVLARGDRHFASRVFIEQHSTDENAMPEILHDVIHGSRLAEDFAVDCSFDPSNHMFKVERIGPQSAIGQVWGTFPTSYPCQVEGSFGDVVNASYEAVLRTGKPRYDHVLAALRLPDNAVHWVPYQRVVVPRRVSGKDGVGVFAQITKVDIQVL